MAQTVFETLDEVRGAVGRHLGTTDWVAIAATEVGAFAAATGEPGPAEVVPPLLVLALTNRFLPEIMEVRGAALGVNYGTGPVRFGPPTPVGSRVRCGVDLVACEDVRGGIQTTMRITVEVAGREEPACVVDALSRWLS